MNDNLIEKIVRRLLTDPAFVSLMKANHPVSKPKTQAIILLDNNPELFVKSPKIAELLTKNYALAFLGKEQSDVLKDGGYWVKWSEVKNIAEYDCVLIPNCSLNILAKIALGLRDCPICEITGRALAAGIKTELVLDSNIADIMPANYRRLYEEYLNKVRCYGVIIRNSIAELCSERIEKVEATAQDSACLDIISEKSQGPDLINWDKKLLTEKDALTIPANAVLRLMKKTIISPLAGDRLRERGIEICKDMGV